MRDSEKHGLNHSGFLTVFRYPSTPFEFYKLIPKLVELAEYHLVIPSLPGSGWPDVPLAKATITLEDVGDIMGTSTLSRT